MQHKAPVFGINQSRALKGIAILMLIFHHTFRIPDYYTSFDFSFFPFAESQINNAAAACKICVSVFAFISGYGLFESFKNKADGVSASGWTAVRFIKTFSTYWLVWVCAATAGQLLGGRTTRILFCDGTCSGVFYSLIDFLGLAKLFRTPTLNGTWWYMTTAAFFILLLPLLYRVRDELPIALLFSVFFLRIITGKNGPEMYPGSNNTYPYLFVFILGIMFARYGWFEKWAGIGRGKKSVLLLKFIAEAAAVLLGCKVFHSVPVESFWEFHYGIFPLIVILFCIDFVVIIPFLNTFLEFMGRHSMTIFLTHSFLYDYLRRYIYCWKHFMLVFAAVLAGSLILSFAVDLAKRLLRFDRLVNALISRTSAQ